MNKKTIIQSVAFLVLGVGLFCYAYKDIGFEDIGKGLQETRYRWIAVSVLFGLLSHLLRALRWDMLIRSMGYMPKLSNLFLSILVLYFINLVFPRGGEIARCSVVSQYENIPFSKLLGTVFVERLSDLLAFLFIFTGVFFWQFSFLKELFISSSYEISMDIDPLSQKIAFAITGVLVFGLLFFTLKRLGAFVRILTIIEKIKKDFKVGITSVLEIKNRGLYVVYTMMMFFMWLMMLYVVFFAYPPTSHLSIKIALITYVIGILAYLLPVQGGIGVWHLFVMNCLFIFGIDKEHGAMFALIAHTFTNLIYLGFGAIGTVILPLVNTKK